MPATCLHGLPPAECLICRTLGTAPVPARPGPGPVKATAGPVEPATGPDHPRRHWGAAHVVAVGAGIVAIGVVAWMLVGLAFALFHVIELLVVAGVAGWAGYRLGHYRGRRGS